VTAHPVLARVIRSVVAGAVDAAAARGVVVLEEWTPEGELLYEWLVEELGEERVWRAASLRHRLIASDRPPALFTAAAEAGALVAHPAHKTALLLGGRIPLADLLPLGDVWASQVERLTGRWTASPELDEAAAAAGGIGALDAALRRMVEAREEPSAALASLPLAAAQQVALLYERGRFYRMRPRLVPKLGPRTLGVDLFD
jgi:hypothetical protein